MKNYIVMKWRFTFGILLLSFTNSFGQIFISLNDYVALK